MLFFKCFVSIIFHAKKIKAQKKPVVYLVDEDAEDLGNSPVLIIDATTRIYLITSNLIYFADFDSFTVERNKQNVSIRLYDDLPLQITLMVDEQVMTSVGERDPPTLQTGA